MLSGEWEHGEFVNDKFYTHIPDWAVGVVITITKSRIRGDPPVVSLQTKDHGVVIARPQVSDFVPKLGDWMEFKVIPVASPAPFNGDSCSFKMDTKKSRFIEPPVPTHLRRVGLIGDTYAVCLTVPITTVDNRFFSDWVGIIEGEPNKMSETAIVTRIYKPIKELAFWSFCVVSREKLILPNAVLEEGEDTNLEPSTLDLKGESGSNGRCRDFQKEIRRLSSDFGNMNLGSNVEDGDENDDPVDVPDKFIGLVVEELENPYNDEYPIAVIYHSSLGRVAAIPNRDWISKFPRKGNWIEFCVDPVEMSQHNCQYLMDNRNFRWVEAPVPTFREKRGRLMDIVLELPVEKSAAGSFYSNFTGPIIGESPPISAQNTVLVIYSTHRNVLNAWTLYRNRIDFLSNIGRPFVAQKEAIPETSLKPVQEEDDKICNLIVQECLIDDNIANSIREADPKAWATMESLALKLGF